MDAFREAAECLRELDSTVVWDVGSSVRSTGDIPCHLSLWHRNAPDPHLELTAVVTPVQDLYRITADIACYEGQGLAELQPRFDRGLTAEEAIVDLRRFLERNVGVLRRMGAA